MRRRLLFAAAGLWACGGAPAPVAPHDMGPGRPALLTVQGGERGALTLVALTAQDPEAALLLGDVVAARVRERGARAGLFVDAEVASAFGADGYRITAPVGRGQEAATVALLRAAYMDPIGASEAEARASKRSALVRLPPAEAGARALAQCRGEFFRSPGAPSQLEELRRRHTSAVSLGFSGGTAAGEAVRNALQNAPSWQLTGAVSSSPTGDDETWVVRAVADHETRVHVLDWRAAADARGHVALGRALGEPGALAVPLAALGVQLERADATFAPRGGACLVVTLRWPERPSETSLAQAIALTHSRLGSLAPAARARASRPEWLAEGAASSGEVAESAAYAALGERSAGAKRQRYVIDWPQSHGEPALPSAAALERALAEQTRMRSSGIAVHEVVRPGLADAWMLLASPCGTQGEADTDAGASGAYALAAAARASALGATAIPWVSASRAGILLRRPRVHGEPPAERAERLAEIAARAWLGDDLDLEAALRELERADAGGRLDGSGLAFPEGDAHGALAFGAVASLRPYGSVRSRRTLRGSAVRLRGATLARGPLAVGYVGPSAGEAEHARRVLASMLQTTGSCPAAAPSTAQRSGDAGRMVRVPGDGNVVLALLRVPASLDALALATAAEYFRHSLPQLLASQLRSSQVDLWGEGDQRVLALRLELPRGVRGAALTELRRALDELAHGRGAQAALWTRAAAVAQAHVNRRADDLPSVVDDAWTKASGQRARIERAPGSAASVLQPLCDVGNLVLVVPES